VLLWFISEHPCFFVVSQNRPLCSTKYLTLYYTLITHIQFQPFNTLEMSASLRPTRAAYLEQYRTAYPEVSSWNHTRNGYFYQCKFRLDIVLRGRSLAELRELIWEKKGKASENIVCIWNIADSVSLKLFINANKRCQPTEAF